jgi:DNA-binding NarL/FixJ family response regulator
MTPGVPEHLAHGAEALASCDWRTARDGFERACAADPDCPEAVDGLGQALYWLGDYPRALQLRERAFALFRRHGRNRPAGLVAVRLAMLHALITGNEAVVGGWLALARRALDECGDCPEQGWYALFLAAATDDPAERARLAENARSAGRRLGDAGLEFDALSYLGKALVEQGRVDAGMALVDEAVAAIACGLVSDPWATGEIYCSLFHSCEIALDIRRAEAWLLAVDRYVERTGELPISAICRMHYGGLLCAAGRWAAAERELGLALKIYAGTYVGSRAEPVLRLAELRVRQGRDAEAAQLLEGAEDRPEAALPVALLHLMRAQPALAGSVATRALAARPDDIRAVPLLAVLAQAELAAGNLPAAEAAVARLDRVAIATGLPAVRGAVALARARVAARKDTAEAGRCAEEAVRAFAEADLAGELAVARLELARAIGATRPDVARAEARRALHASVEVGDGRRADEAAALLRALGDRSRPYPRRSRGSVDALTQREEEVLALLGQGLSNADIAARLVISPRTAEHHVGNVLAKLGLSSRAEVAALLLRRTERAGDRHAAPRPPTGPDRQA